MPFPLNRHNGYLAAIVGSLLVAGIFIPLGWQLGFFYARQFMPNAELEGLIPPILGGALGWWMGAVLGCWLALRWRACPKAGRTAALLASLTPFGIFLSFQIFVKLSPWIWSTDNQFQSAQAEQRLVMQLIIGLMASVLAWLSRFLT